jgi:hypothetical protein
MHNSLHQAEPEELSRRIAWVASLLASAKLVSFAASNAWVKYFRAPFLSPSIWLVSFMQQESTLSITHLSEHAHVLETDSLCTRASGGSGICHLVVVLLESLLRYL